MKKKIKEIPLQEYADICKKNKSCSSNCPFYVDKISDCILISSNKLSKEEFDNFVNKEIDV